MEVPTQAAQGGNVDDQRVNVNPSPGDYANQGTKSASQAPEDLYGDWIIVNKSRKSSQGKKGKTEAFSKTMNLYEKKGDATKGTDAAGAPGSSKPHGIKTMLNVKVISGNHLRFVDEKEPPPDIAPHLEHQAREMETVDASSTGEMLVDGASDSNPG
ncbi:hypothetical protein SESBI_17096 [Sesbania bispinosa]|nr:hypothetical protein SESBI_17096 [Sesbania bispinosa]